MNTTDQHTPLPIAQGMRRAKILGLIPGALKHDLAAGLVVSLVALPLAMALSIAVGLTPKEGLYTAVVAGVFTALLGGSLHQVTGPTAAFVVVLAPIVAQSGLRGLILVEIVAGAMLVVMAFLRLGRYVNYVPYPVTAGFTAGIAVVIGVLSLNDFLGLGLDLAQGEFVHKVGLLATSLGRFRLPEFAVGLVTLLVVVGARHLVPKIPSPLLGVLAGTGLGMLLEKLGAPVATIGSRFSYTLPDGTVGRGVPPIAPSLHWFSEAAGQLFAPPSFVDLKTALAPAFTVALLAAVESLLSASVADGMTGERHDPDAELFGCGVGNILCGFVAGIPATGAVARTATNVQAGAKTPLAAVIHGLLLLLYMLLLAPWLSYVPMASLAGLMLVVAWSMSHYKHCLRIIRIAPGEDTIVLAACFILTVFIDMTAGVVGGLVLAGMLFAKRMAQSLEAKTESCRLPSIEENRDVPDDVLVYHIDGCLFFGSTAKALHTLRTIGAGVKRAVIDLEHVPLMDMTGLNMLHDVVETAVKRGVEVSLCGPRPLLKTLARDMTAPVRERVFLFRTVDKALARITTEDRTVVAG